jgi:hypothetical protein
MFAFGSQSLPHMTRVSAGLQQRQPLQFRSLPAPVVAESRELPLLSWHRKSLLENWNFKLLLDCTACKLFKAATVHNAITVFQNNLQEVPDVGYTNTLDAESFEELAGRKALSLSKTDLEVNNVNWGLVFKLPQKITACTSSGFLGPKSV